MAGPRAFQVGISGRGRFKKSPALTLVGKAAGAVEPSALNSQLRRRHTARAGISDCGIGRAQKRDQH